MLLYYREQGILVRYYGPIENEERNVVSSEESIRMCPHRTEMELWLWFPQDALTLADIAGMNLYFTEDELAYYRSLEDATGMTIDEFYHLFVEPGNQYCLETPAELW